MSNFNIEFFFEINILAKKLRSSPLEVFLAKGILKIPSKFTREHPCQSLISMTLLTLSNGCSSVNLVHIFRTPFPKNVRCRAAFESYFMNVWHGLNFVQKKRCVGNKETNSRQFISIEMINYRFYGSVSFFYWTSLEWELVGSLAASIFKCSKI